MLKYVRHFLWNKIHFRVTTLTQFIKIRVTFCNFNIFKLKL